MLSRVYIVLSNLHVLLCSGRQKPAVALFDKLVTQHLQFIFSSLSAKEDKGELEENEVVLQDSTLAFFLLAFACLQSSHEVCSHATQTVSAAASIREQLLVRSVHLEVG